MAAPDIVDPVTAGLLTTHAAGTLQLVANSFAFVTQAAQQKYLTQLGQPSFLEASAMQEARTSAQSREILQSQAAMSAPKVPA